jgi:hypothetical protein
MEGFEPSADGFRVRRTLSGAILQGSSAFTLDSVTTRWSTPPDVSISSLAVSGLPK